MKGRNLVFFGLGVVLVAVSVWQIAAAQRGLKVINLHTTNPPVTIITPAGIPPASRPTVLIAHGFAGSAVLMRGFALTLAHAGYTTVLWDFEGHGANPNPLLQSTESTGLLHDAESALSQAETTGLVDTGRVAILGHSMGSGVALSYGVTHPETYATMAVSPTSQAVSPSLPHNLLLMAGSLEPQFVGNAEQLLAEAGGAGGDLATGTARKLVVVPNVEHISILFSPTAHSLARTWVDGTFGSQPGGISYTDRRIVWFVVGILGLVCLSAAGINSLSKVQIAAGSGAPLWLRLAAMVGGVVVGTLILWLVSRVGIHLNQLLGILVGGYMIIWFGVTGGVALLILRPHISWPKSSTLIQALIAFLALWLGVGLIGNFVWLPWLLISPRLILWIPASIIVFPWFFAVGQAASQARLAGQIGWWLVQVVMVVGGLLLAIRLNPELGFIVLILPVIPVMLGLQALAVSPKHGAWAYGISGAMFTAWLLLAVFPLQ